MSNQSADMGGAYADLKGRVQSARLAKGLAVHLGHLARTQGYVVIDHWLESSRNFANSMGAGGERSIYNDALVAHPLCGSVLDSLLEAFECDELQLASIVATRMHDSSETQGHVRENGRFDYEVDIVRQGGRLVIVLRAIERARRVA